jgi:hypothetical protein
MIADLVCLAWFLMVMTAAGVVIVRMLRRAAAGAACGPVCLRCGEPAASFMSFDCPRCGHDVREAGVGVPRTGSVHLTLAHLLLATFCLIATAAVVTAALRAAATPHQFFNLSRLEVTAAPPPLGTWTSRIEMTAVGDWVQEGPAVDVDLYADLHLSDGGLSVLHVSVPDRSCSWTLPGADRAQPQGRLTRELFDQWLTRSGATFSLFRGMQDTESVAAGWYRDLNDIADGGDLRRLGIGATTWNTPTHWSGGGSVGVSPWLDRAAVVVWPTLWLALLLAVTRPRRGRRARLMPTGATA